MTLAASLLGDPAASSGAASAVDADERERRPSFGINSAEEGADVVRQQRTVALPLASDSDPLPQPDDARSQALITEGQREGQRAAKLAGLRAEALRIDGQIEAELLRTG